MSKSFGEKAEEIARYLECWINEELGYFPPGEYGRIKLRFFRENKIPLDLHGNGREGDYYKSAAEGIARKLDSFLSDVECKDLLGDVTLNDAIEFTHCLKFTSQLPQTSSKKYDFSLKYL